MVSLQRRSRIDNVFQKQNRSEARRMPGNQSEQAKIQTERTTKSETGRKRVGDCTKTKQAPLKSGEMFHLAGTDKKGRAAVQLRANETRI